MAVQIETRISWGQIITVVVLLIGFATQYATYGKQVDETTEIAIQNRERIVDLEKQVLIRDGQIKALHKSVEHQTRILITIAEEMGIKVHPLTID